MLSFFAGASIFFAPPIHFLTVDPSNRSMFVKTDPEYVFYREFNERYGSDEIIVVALRAKQFFTLANLRLLKELTARIEDLPHVEKVISLA